MLRLGTQTKHPVIRLNIHDLFDFITELFCTKQKAVSLVENIFILTYFSRSHISGKCIQLANHEVSNIASPTECVCAM